MSNYEFFSSPFRSIPSDINRKLHKSHDREEELRKMFEAHKKQLIVISKRSEKLKNYAESLKLIEKKLKNNKIEFEKSHNSINGEIDSKECELSEALQIFEENISKMKESIANISIYCESLSKNIQTNQFQMNSYEKLKETTIINEEIDENDFDDIKKQIDSLEDQLKPIRKRLKKLSNLAQRNQTALSTIIGEKQMLSKECENKRNSIQKENKKHHLIIHNLNEQIDCNEEDLLRYSEFVTSINLNEIKRASPIPKLQKSLDLIVQKEMILDKTLNPLRIADSCFKEEYESLLELCREFNDGAQAKKKMIRAIQLATERAVNREKELNTEIETVRDIAKELLVDQFETECSIERFIRENNNIEYELKCIDQEIINETKEQSKLTDMINESAEEISIREKNNSEFLNYESDSISLLKDIKKRISEQYIEEKKLVNRMSNLTDSSPIVESKEVACVKDSINSIFIGYEQRILHTQDMIKSLTLKVSNYSSKRMKNSEENHAILSNKNKSEIQNSEMKCLESSIRNNECFSKPNIYENQYIRMIETSKSLFDVVNKEIDRIRNQPEIRINQWIPIISKYIANARIILDQE